MITEMTGMRKNGCERKIGRGKERMRDKSTRKHMEIVEMKTVNNNFCERNVCSIALGNENKLKNMLIFFKELTNMNRVIGVLGHAPNAKRALDYVQNVVYEPLKTTLDCGPIRYYQDSCGLRNNASVPSKIVKLIGRKFPDVVQASTAFFPTEILWVWIL